MKVQKASSSHAANIPLMSILDVVQDGKEFTVSLNGRIQWITSHGFYKLLPTQPKDSLGIPKVGSPGSSDAPILQQKLSEKGYYTQWNQLAEVNAAGYEVAYDDDGKYFRCEGRMTGWVEILVAKR
jgi:hypothetical protein